MLIRFDVFSNEMMRSFDAVCDELGGMDDIDFVNRMLAFTNYKVAMLNLKVRLLVGVNHNQSAKEERELDAMREIMKLRKGQIKRWIAAWKAMGIPEDL